LESLSDDLEDIEDEESIDDLLEGINTEESSEETMEGEDEISEDELLALDDSLDLDGGLDEDDEEIVEVDDDNEEDEFEEKISEELTLEDQIESAVGELTEEELESELDEDTLLGIVSSEMDAIDSLNARDLQIAIGEEVTAEAPQEEEKTTSLDEDSEDTMQEDPKSDDVSNLEIEANNEGIESLKKLLEALSQKDVAASMKGAKISINIELGDK